MVKAIATRIGSTAAVLLVLSLAVFFIQRTLPADPVRALVGRTASPEVIAAARERLGLDQPVIVQYFQFLGGLLRGDAGTSLRTRNPVLDDIAAYLPATLELVVVAITIALVAGFVLGVVSSRGGWLSTGVTAVSVAGSSAATFLVAILAVLVFYRNLGWFPAGGQSSSGAAVGPTGFVLVDTLLSGDLGAWFDAWHHVLLPAAVLAVGPAVAIGRTFRGSLRSTLQSEFIRSAYAKGFGWHTVVLRHATRNALGPAVSMAGLQLGMLFAGSIVVEKVFSWPGVGGYLFNSIGVSDFPAIVGVVLVMGLIYVVVNFAVDMIQLAVDPRQRKVA
ncbi:peptide/nickel transport system permease protein [Conyzicola lurida]|uniref:Peptide/nickel transport system permease protein n=1 Tax=Conyzicola lurida TaxID=1172621 RepID=A0A841AJ24_9MICO|nr:ABC transporter permease [Conyzicola lurida]MBB5841736.1 peptide/nickel transport system permease protein [Conyzicola lurida]